jgi:hypothetical protein
VAEFPLPFPFPLPSAPLQGCQYEFKGIQGPEPYVAVLPLPEPLPEPSAEASGLPAELPLPEPFPAMGLPFPFPLSEDVSTNEPPVRLRHTLVAAASDAAERLSQTTKFGEVTQAKVAETSFLLDRSSNGGRGQKQRHDYLELHGVDLMSDCS